MDTKQLFDIHKQIVDLYRNSIFSIVAEYFNNDANSTQEKSDGKYASTLVSSADLSINKVLGESLPKIVPGAGIISEENKDEVVNKYTFVIDPIDGTHSFVRGLDDWGVSISLCESGEVVYSVIFFPFCKTKYYYALKSAGAFDSDDKKVTPRKFFSFKPAFVCAPSSRKIGRALIDYTKGKMLSFRAYGSAVYAVYTLLRGGNDFVIFDNLSLWDILGCVFISEEAGLISYWISEKPKFDTDVDFKNTKYTVMLYKHDFDKKLLSEIQKIITKS